MCNFDIPFRSYQLYKKKPNYRYDSIGYFTCRKSKNQLKCLQDVDPTFEISVDVHQAKATQVRDLQGGISGWDRQLGDLRDAEPGR